MRQPHPELNFRIGRGRIRERRKAFSHDSLAATCDFLGMSAEDKAKFLAETDAIRESEDNPLWSDRPSGWLSTYNNPAHKR